MTSIGSQALANLAKVTSLDLSQCTGLEKIPYQFCHGCYRLNSLKLPTSLTEIGDMAFEYAQIGSVDLYSMTSLRKIGMKVFRQIPELTSIGTPPTVGGQQALLKATVEAGSLTRQLPWTLVLQPTIVEPLTDMV